LEREIRVFEPYVADDDAAWPPRLAKFFAGPPDDLEQEVNAQPTLRRREDGELQVWVPDRFLASPYVRHHDGMPAHTRRNLLRFTLGGPFLRDRLDERPDEVPAHRGDAVRGKAVRRQDPAGHLRLLRGAGDHEGVANQEPRLAGKVGVVAEAQGVGGEEDLPGLGRHRPGGHGREVARGDDQPFADVRLEDLVPAAEVSGPRPHAAIDDAPSCSECGMLMVRNGSCYKCLNCGNSMGCS